MSLIEKIKTAINNYGNHSNKDAYQDNYDGFTHWTYSGLANDVIDALNEDGHGEKTSMRIVNDYVSQMI